MKNNLLIKAIILMFPFVAILGLAFAKDSVSDKTAYFRVTCVNERGVLYEGEAEYLRDMPGGAVLKEKSTGKHVVIVGASCLFKEI